MSKEEMKARIIVILSIENSGNKDFSSDKILDRDIYFKNYPKEKEEYFKRNKEYYS